MAVLGEGRQVKEGLGLAAKRPTLEDVALMARKHCKKNIRCSPDDLEDWVQDAVVEFALRQSRSNMPLGYSAAWQSIRWSFASRVKAISNGSPDSGRVKIAGKPLGENIVASPCHDGVEMDSIIGTLTEGLSDSIAVILKLKVSGECWRGIARNLGVSETAAKCRWARALPVLKERWAA